MESVVREEQEQTWHREMQNMAVPLVLVTVALVGLPFLVAQVADVGVIVHHPMSIAPHLLVDYMALIQMVVVGWQARTVDFLAKMALAELDMAAVMAAAAEEQT